MNMTKRWFGFLFSLALVLLPVMSLTAYADDVFDTLNANNTEVTISKVSGHS